MHGDGTAGEVVPTFSSVLKSPEIAGLLNFRFRRNRGVASIAF
jgi:hypothetical protein